jgi:phosphatidylinositol-3-phosphatase
MFRSCKKRELRIFTTRGRYLAILALPLTAKRDEQADDRPIYGPEQEPVEQRLPAPWSLAMAVLAMLTLGVLIGSVTAQSSENAGFNTVLLEAAEEEEEEAASGETSSAEAPEVRASGGEATTATAASALPAETALVEEPLTGEPEPEVPVIEEELPTGLPDVKHVFVVMLNEGGFEETFGKAAESPYLGKELPQQGELLTNYFAVTKGVLANQIALLSGQGPTLATAAGCPSYGDVLPATESPAGQVEGEGCAYPATTKTLLGQLAEAELAWKAYREGPEGCSNPPADPADLADPLLYFHSILDDPACAERDVGLPQLATDLKLKAEEFPALAYVTPDEAQLKAVITEIKKSLAYKDGGMIVVTAAQAPQEGEHPDESGCCIDPDFPNLPGAPSEVAPTGPVHETDGGGRVGLLLLSPYVEPGTTSETYFNHFSLLITIEELFELERIGYGAEPALTGFDESIFNAAG